MFSKTLSTFCAELKETFPELSGPLADAVNRTPTEYLSCWGPSMAVLKNPGCRGSVQGSSLAWCISVEAVVVRTIGEYESLDLEISAHALSRSVLGDRQGSE